MAKNKHKSKVSALSKPKSGSARQQASSGKQQVGSGKQQVSSGKQQAGSAKQQVSSGISRTNSKHKTKLLDLNKPKTVKRMQELGLPIPSNVDIGTKDFIKLQNQWYKKLKSSGFEDIEWLDKSTGLGQNSDFLKDPDQMKTKAYKSETEFFYQMCTNFMTHVKIEPARLRYLFKLYSEGMPYRDIRKALVKRYRKYVSLYFVFYHVKRLKEQMFHFNKTHPEGLWTTRTEPDMELLQYTLEEADTDLDASSAH